MSEKTQQIKQAIEILAKELNLPERDILWSLVRGLDWEWREVNEYLRPVFSEIPLKQEYVKTKHGTLRIGGIKYYSAVGAWSVGYRVIDGQLVIWEPRGAGSNLHLTPLYPATEDEFVKEENNYNNKLRR